MDPPASSSRCDFFRDFRIEPVILVSVIIGTAGNTAMQQLMQDKLCISRHSLDHEFCRDLAEKDPSHEKSVILADVAFYSSLREYITVIPKICLTILIGSWCDRWPATRRYVMILSMIGLALDSALLLLNSQFLDWDFRFIILCNIPSAFLCNGLSMAICSYIIATTEETSRSGKFLLMDVFVRLGVVTGFLSSGAILTSTPMLMSESGTKNHSEVFLMNMITALAGLVWVCFRIRVTSEPEDEDAREALIEGDEGRESATETTPLFAWNIVRETTGTLTRVRPSQHHRYLWLLLFVYFAIQFPQQGLSYMMYPLTELLYKWDIRQYGFMNAFFEAFTAITLSCFTVIVKRINPRPTAITMIGLTSSTIGLISIGSITSVQGYYLSGYAGSLTAAASSGIRSFLSHIIPADEITRVYSLTQLMETVIAAVSPTMSSLILRESISLYPTLIFHAYAVMMMTALVIVAIVDVSVRKRSRLDALTESAATIET